MTKDKIKKIEQKYLERFRKETVEGDPEGNHWSADCILCDLLDELGCTEITAEFNALKKWYA